MHNDLNLRVPTLEELYPDCSEEERAVIDEAWTRYARFCLDMYKSLMADPERRAKFEALIKKNQEGE